MFAACDSQDTPPVGGTVDHRPACLPVLPTSLVDALRRKEFISMGLCRDTKTRSLPKAGHRENRTIREGGTLSLPAQRERQTSAHRDKKHHSDVFCRTSSRHPAKSVADAGDLCAPPRASGGRLD
jgi:hypothetical protein